MGAQIPTWAIMSVLGMKAGGNMLSAFGQGKQTDKMLEQRNKEFLAKLALENKQLRQNQQQFEDTMKLKQSETKRSEPSRAMEILSMLSALGKKQPSTADTMGALLGAM